MSLRAEFDRYLDRLGETVPVSVLHRESETQGLCALRHDVDHDIDVALEMAHREYYMGARASYYILPTAPYWQDARLIDKCLQLQDYGHEVGLHVNCMAQWVGGEIDDPEQILQEQLDRLRNGGVKVTGVSAHGDRRCYEHNISNYWCFKELRPVDPVATESGRTAEGLMTAESRYQLVYPNDDMLIRPDGSRYALWSISMAALGLEYHAWHVPHDRYFSDSGGSWSRTPDPISLERGIERWQVLIHPIHWRGPGRLYFFLSTARSGSRWLSEVLNQATPLTARHEYILNQDFHRGETSHKATSNFRSLEGSPEIVHERLLEAWEELEQMDGDYAEVNVYLSSFIDQLRRIFPRATFVHLYRNPAQVVRSLMDRDWYDTPEDHAHPRLKKADPGNLSQFERVCQYVAETNELLLDACDDRISLDDMTGSPDELCKVLNRFAIPYHPRLGYHLVGKVINATESRRFPSPDHWTAWQKEKFEELAGKVTQEMGFTLLRQAYGNSIVSKIDSIFKKVYRRAKLAIQSRNTRKRLFCNTIRIDIGRFYGAHCDLIPAPDGLVIRPNSNDNHAYVCLAGSRWQRALLGEGAQSGWAVCAMGYLRGAIEAQIPKGTNISIFAISYGRDGKQQYRRQLGIMDSNHPRLAFSFSLYPDATVFDIALYMPVTQLRSDVLIKSCHMESCRIQ